MPIEQLSEKPDEWRKHARTDFYPIAVVAAASMRRDGDEVVPSIDQRAMAGVAHRESCFCRRHRDHDRLLAEGNDSEETEGHQILADRPNFGKHRRTHWNEPDERCGDEYQQPGRLHVRDRLVDTALENRADVYDHGSSFPARPNEKGEAACTHPEDEAELFALASTRWLERRAITTIITASINTKAINNIMMNLDM